MKRSGLFSVVALLLLAACGESPTSPSALRTFAPSFDRTSTGASVVSAPFDATIGIDCAGETVEVSGTLLSIYHVVINGQKATVYQHFSPQNVSGVGSVTGAKYRATGVTEQSETTSLGEGSAELTFVNNFRIIGQGTGNNYTVHEVFHATVNANGTSTAYFDTVSEGCK